MIDFKTRTIYLIGPEQANTIVALVPNLPLDGSLEVVIRAKTTIRKPSANDRMWAGPLKDIAEQAWLHGRQFKDVIWHEYFKEYYLPDESASDFDSSHVKEGYKKWDIDPAGKRRLVGSTTQLTRTGFHIYMLQLEAEGSNLGVQYSVNPKEIR